MTMRALASGALTAAAVCAVAAPADAQFYKGKMLTMMVNYGAGGNTDVEGRVFLRHLPKHLEGNPTTTVSYRPGAGGIVGINWLGSANAQPDGLLFCFCTLNVVEPLIGGPSLTVKYEDFAFIAGVHQWIVGYGRRDIKPGLRKPSDMAKAVDVFGAGYNPSTPHDMRSKLSLDIMGAKFSMVTGFQSIGNINKAIEQNEVNFALSSMPAYMGQAIPNLIKPGIAKPLWYFPIVDASGKAIKRSPELDALGVPLYADVYRDAHGKPPSGAKWEALSVVNNLATTMLRAVLMPKGTPPQAVEEMRRAFVAVAEDKEFQAEYEKIVKVKAEMVSAKDGEAILASMKNVSPATAAVLKDFSVRNK
jgi:hypothetical protein